MQIIINSSISTLSKSKLILLELSDEQLTKSDIPPYSACIGSHIRHILDFYDCIYNGLDKNEVDLTNRRRDIRIEQSCVVALSAVEFTMEKLRSLSSEDPSRPVQVWDDLGGGKVRIEYTLGALLAQANSHTIHHYAIISYLLQYLGVEMKDPSFGYNPTTPISDINLN